MGLDMYIFKDDGKRGNDELVYWRKHHNLHYWFEELAIDKGIEFDSFNTVKVPLTSEDIEACLEALPEIYDDDEYAEDNISYTKAQLTPLRFKVGTGLNVYYDSWL